jgi:hypothetical protein
VLKWTTESICAWRGGRVSSVYAFSPLFCVPVIQETQQICMSALASLNLCNCFHNDVEHWCSLFVSCDENRGMPKKSGAHYHLLLQNPPVKKPFSGGECNVMLEKCSLVRELALCDRVSISKLMSIDIRC